MCFSYSTPREIDRGLKCIWDLQMGGTPSSARIIEYVDRALEELLIVFRVNGSSLRGSRIEMGTEGKK